MEPMQEVSSYVLLRELIQKFEWARSLDPVLTRSFLIENRESLVSNGACAFQLPYDQIIGCPFWLYPDVKIISTAEKAMINREVVLSFKMAVLELLFDIKEKDWIDAFTSLIRKQEELVKNAHFYLAVDRAYATNCVASIGNVIPKKVERRVSRGDGSFSTSRELRLERDPCLLAGGLVPGSSGGLSDILECVYEKYERYHFRRRKHIRAFLGGKIPSSKDISQVEERLKDQKTSDELFEILSEYSTHQKHFRRTFIQTVNDALGIERKKVAERKSQFCFHEIIIRRFELEPFSHSPSYTWIRYGSDEFSLNEVQATIIGFLHKQHRKNPAVYVSQKDISNYLSKKLPSAVGGNENADKFRVEEKFRDKVAQKALGKPRLYKAAYHRLIEIRDKSKTDGNKKLNYYRLRLPTRA